MRPNLQPPRSPMRPRPWTALVSALALTVSLACGAPSLEEIRALQDAGAYEESLEPLREILSGDPDNAEASYRLGMALLRTGRMSQALWPLRRAADSDDFAKPAGLILASTLLSMSNFEDAYDSASRVLERDPENEAALTTRSRAALEGKRPLDSLADVERLLTLNPENLEAMAMRAAILADMERWDEANESFEASYEMAKAQSSPFIVRTCMVWAKSNAVRGDLERAVAGVDKCLADHRDDPAAVPTAVGAYQELERPDRAIALLGEALDKNPDDVQTVTAYAGFLKAAGRQDEAEQLMLEAAERLNAPALWSAVATQRAAQRDYTGAREALEKTRELTRDNSESLRFAIAVLYIDEGNLEKGEELMQSLEEDLFREILAGRLALERGDPAGALELLEPTIVQWPNYEPTRMWAARAALELGDVDRGLRQLREATRVAPKESNGGVLLARHYLAQGDRKAAYELARRHLKERGFTSPEAHLIMARSATAIGRYGVAMADLEKLAAIPGQEPLAYAEMADVERAKDGLDAALASVESRTLDLSDPANSVLLFKRLDLLFDVGRTQAAVELATGLRDRSPEDARLHAILGQTLLRTGDAGGAIAEFDRALALDEEDAMALAGRAQIARATGDAAGAVALFDRAAAADPEQPAYRYGAAQARLAAGDVEGARRELKELVHAHPELGGPANDLAWLLAESGESLDFALRLAQRAKTLSLQAEVLDTLGWVHFKRGELAEASDAFREAIELNPEYATARYHLGLTLAKQGERQAALEELRSAVASGGPDAEAARTEIARLQSAE